MCHGPLLCKSIKKQNLHQKNVSLSSGLPPEAFFVLPIFPGSLEGQFGLPLVPVLVTSVPAPTWWLSVDEAAYNPAQSWAVFHIVCLSACLPTYPPTYLLNISIYHETGAYASQAGILNSLLVKYDLHF